MGGLDGGKDGKAMSLRGRDHTVFVDRGTIESDDFVGMVLAIPHLDVCCAHVSRFSTEDLRIMNGRRQDN